MIYVSFCFDKVHFLSLFCPLFTRFYQRTHTLSILTQNKKNIFFSNCITFVKTVTQPICDKGFVAFIFQLFFLNKIHFLDFFSVKFSRIFQEVIFLIPIILFQFLGTCTMIFHGFLLLSDHYRHLQRKSIEDYLDHFP